MPLSPGDHVLVIALKRRGQVLERQGARYRVVVGGLTMTCREQDLRADAPVMRKRQAARTAAPTAGGPDDPAAPVRRIRSSIDLHGMTVPQAREALLAHIDTALRNGEDIVEVVHGIGTGRVRAAVVAVLRSIPSARKVQPHPTNRGVTLVYL